MAQKAAQAANMIVDIALESLHIFAETGSIFLAVSPVIGELAYWFKLLKENKELRFKVLFPAGIIAMLTGVALILEDWDDFAIEMNRWHHWMLGVIIFILGLVLIGLAFKYGL